MPHTLLPRPKKRPAPDGSSTLRKKQRAVASLTLPDSLNAHEYLLKSERSLELGSEKELVEDGLPSLK